MDRRGALRRLLALAGCVLAGVLLTTPKARAALHHPGHDCPKCGRVQTVIYCFKRGGGHYHCCGGRTYWWH